MALLNELFDTDAMRPFKDRVEKIIGLQRQARSVEDLGQRRKDEGTYRRMLDSLYWEIFEVLCQVRLSGKGSRFTLAEKLLINFGYLDPSQLDKVEESNPAQLEATLTKLQGRSPYDEAPIYRLDEWASIWKMNAQLFESQQQKPAPPQEDWLDDDKAQKYAMTRLNIYKKLLPTLKTLPGANLNFLKSLLEGDFDKKVETCMVLELKAPDKVELGHRRIIALHKTLLDQLRAAVQDPEVKKLIVLLDKINHSFVQRRLRQDGFQDNKDEETRSSSELKSDFIGNEIKLIKNLLPIGGMEGKEFFTSPILRQTQPLISKTFVGDTLKLIHLCDPHVPKNLPLIIVPFRGSGFFEFDKNTLIIPLFPSLAPQEVVIRAVANYRILTDQLEHQGELKRLYEKLFDKGRFKERFLQDYVQWITHISRGHRSIMHSRKFDFFLEFVGPNPKYLLCDPQLKDLPKVQLKRKINDILASTKTTQEDYLILATCHWLNQDIAKALQYCENALTAGMPNPKVFLAYGYALREMKDRAKSQLMFKNCLRYYKDTIWGAYAAHELSRK